MSATLDKPDLTFRVTLSDDRYQIEAALVREDSGFSVHAVNLPGVVSCGETVEEAVRNIMDAASGAIECYKEDGEDIPWGHVDVETEIGPVELRKWIVVNG